MRKRFLSLVLSVLMVMLLMAPASASEEASGVPVESSEVMTGNELVGEVALELEEEDLIISEEVAGYIAEFFICDMIETEQTCWDDSTAIVDTTLMYDETGNDVTGYTFKLTTGYIVVSAYLDIPSLILEWFDVEAPVYENAEMDSEDKVVYLGALDYYIDAGEADLETVEGETVLRDELTNGFEEQRSIENVDEDVLLEIVESKEEVVSPVGISIFAANNNKGGYIIDPIAYAKNVYGGTWWANNWANNWGSYAQFNTTLSLTGLYNHCGPVAITNMIKMYGKKYNNTTINSTTAQSVLQKVISTNTNSKYYDGTNGTWNSSADSFIKDSFKTFSVSVSVFGQYDVTYQKTVNTLGNTNRLMYIMLSDKSTHPYGKHHIVGFAYTRLMNSNGVGSAYIKVCDGSAAEGRYVEIDSISPGAKYWEVCF